MAKKPVSSNADEFAKDSKSKSKYKPEDFMIPAKDGQGQSVRFAVALQPAHDRQIAIILNSRVFPFKTPGDVARWCIHRGLTQLKVMEPVPSVLQQVEAMMQVLRDEEFHQQFQDFLLHAQRVIQRHVREGAHGEARRLTAALRAKVQQMPDGFWKKRYLKAIKEQFEHLLADKGSRVGIGTGSFEDDDDD